MSDEIARLRAIVPPQPDTPDRSRRRFLQVTGAVAAVAMIGCGDDDNTGPDDGGAVVSLPLTSDVDILKFALFLELLEATFYNEAVASGVLSGAVAVLTASVQAHENAHVDALQNALGGQSFGDDDVEFDFGASFASQASFLATAQILEQTGVGAYLGALPMIQSRAYRTVAGSIYTIEARHNAAFRAFTNAPGGPVPGAFETALTPQAVVDAVVGTGFVLKGL